VVEGVMRSDRLRLFLDTKPRLATELLTRAFRGTPDELEAFLVRLERMPKAEANRVLEALVRIGVDDAGQVVLNSGKTVEELLELIGKDSAAAKPLGAYSKQVIGKKFQDLTRRDLVNSATWQDKLFKEATDLRDRQNLLKDQILSDVNRGGKGKSILKRDDFKEFVTGIEQKMERNSYVKVSQMDDIVRGRFDMPDREGVERVYKALDDQKMYKVKEITEPRTVKGDPDVFRYPRYHVILEDAKTGMTHEWQVGTRATTRLYEKEGITIPKALEEAAQRLKKEFHADLHDIEFDVFQRIVKDHPAVAVKYPELPRFIRDVAEASNKSFAGEAFTDLERTIAELHGRATEILKKIVDQEGGEWVAKLFH
jgi:hypothetical protein